ncbi:MAG: hypothetical protein AAFV93_02995 [Chloroflexota bacterium]
MIDRLRRLSFILAYAVATIPLWHYIRDGHILVLMTAVILFTYVMILISSVEVAQPILSSEKAKTTLPKWLPDKTKYHKWWLIVQRTRRWHLMLVIPKMGLSLGFTEYFFQTFTYFRDNLYSVFLYSYNYNSYQPGSIGSFPPFDLPTLSPVQFLLGFLVIVCFSFLETGLSASLILNVTKNPFKRVTKTALNRLGIILSIVFIAVALYQPIVTFTNQLISVTPIRCQIGFESTLGNSNWSRCGQQVAQTIMTAMNTIVGQGTLIASNFMRPLRIGQEYGTYCWDDNRLFLIRQTIALFLGALFYILLIRFNLWFVEDEE